MQLSVLQRLSAACSILTCTRGHTLTQDTGLDTACAHTHTQHTHTHVFISFDTCAIAAIITHIQHIQQPSSCTSLNASWRANDRTPLRSIPLAARTQDAGSSEDVPGPCVRGASRHSTCPIGCGPLRAPNEAHQEERRCLRSHLMESYEVPASR